MKLRTQANISGIVTLALWSFSAVLVSISGGTPPLLLTGESFLCMFLLTCTYWTYKRQNILNKFRIPFKNYALGLYGCSSIAFLFLALKNAPVAEANLLNYAWPALIVVFASIADRIRFNIWEIGSIALCLVGLYAILFRDSSEAAFDTLTIGHFYALLGALVWSSYSVLTRKNKIGSDSMAVICLLFGLICLGLHYWLEPFFMPGPYEWTIIMGLAVVRLGMISWDYAMKNGDVKTIAAMAYVVPLFSNIWLVLAGKVEYSPYIAIGGIGIIGGCLMLGYAKWRR